MDKPARYPEVPFGAGEWETLEQTVVETARRHLVGRRFIDLYGPLGGGVQTVVNDLFEKPERGKMSLHGDATDLSVPTGRVNLTIPMLFKDFVLYRRDIEQSRSLEIPVDFSPAANAAQQCALLEDELIFNGSDSFGLPGLMNVKGRLTHIRGDWMKSGNAFADVVEARNKLLAMGHTGPYALVLSPSLYAMLHRVHEGTRVLEVEHVRELMTDGVYQSPVIRGETGVIVSTGRQNLDLAISEDLDVVFLEMENMNYVFRVYESLVLRIKRPGAICTLESPDGK